MGHVSEHFPWEKLGYSAWENFLELFLTIFPFVPFILISYYMGAGPDELNF